MTTFFCEYCYSNYVWTIFFKNNCCRWSHKMNTDQGCKFISKKNVLIWKLDLKTFGVKWAYRAGYTYKYYLGMIAYIQLVLQWFTVPGYNLVHSTKNLVTQSEIHHRVSKPLQLLEQIYQYWIMPRKKLWKLHSIDISFQMK